MKKKTQKNPMKRWAWLFLGPMLVCFCIGFVWPFLHGTYLSFCRFLLVRDARLIGFGNYAAVFRDPSFLHAFGFTALFAVVSVIMINVPAFAAACALNHKFRGRNLFRAVFFMPNLIGGIVLGHLWSVIFDGILTSAGMKSILENTNTGFWGMIVVLCWQQVGYMMIIYIAGLQAVPADMLEAAEIDGASGRQKLFRIVIPNMMPAITICLFLTLTNGFKLFDQNLALTAGQPFIQQANGTTVRTTEMLALNIYNTFYSQGPSNRGIAQAKAVIFFVMVAGIGLVQLIATRRKEVQQ